MRKIPNGPRSFILLLTVCFLARLSPLAFCEEASAQTGEDLAGPIVRARLDVVKDALSRANLTGDEPEKKKTIAQIIDEALEQEFPEEKVEKIGKDYNETAKQEDVSLFLRSASCYICRSGEPPLF